MAHVTGARIWGPRPYIFIKKSGGPCGWTAPAPQVHTPLDTVQGGFNDERTSAWAANLRYIIWRTLLLFGKYVYFNCLTKLSTFVERCLPMHITSNYVTPAALKIFVIWFGLIILDDFNNLLVLFTWFVKILDWVNNRRKIIKSRYSYLCKVLTLWKYFRKL